MHSLIYLNLQFTAIFSHDFHLQYKARVALDFPLHHLPFSPSSYRKKKNLEISKKPQKIDSIGEFMSKTPKMAPTIFLFIFFIAQTCTQSNKVI